LQTKVLPELQQIAGTLGVTGHQRLKKSELIDAIIAKAPGDGHVDSQDGAAARDGSGSSDARPSAEDTNSVQEDSTPSAPDGGVSTMVSERPQGQDRPRDRRPSREERRRDRERRREREREEREEELANAPVRSGVLDVLPEGYGFLRASGYLPG